MSSKSSIVLDFTQANGLLVLRVRAAAASAELSLTESSVLAPLDRDGPATIADLARAEKHEATIHGHHHCRPGGDGYLERKPHPTDGRQVNFHLTAKGAAMRKTNGDAKRTWLAQAISQLDEHERDILFAAGRIIKRLAEL